VVPFQIDRSWYERYWLTEHPPGVVGHWRNWVLLNRRRRMGRVIPEQDYPNNVSRGAVAWSRQ
jgi:hypothetical protein